MDLRYFNIFLIDNRSCDKFHPNMVNGKILVLIPARYQSMRFPGKPLANIAGKSLIHRVWDNLCTDKEKLDVYVVTDDEKIEKHVLEFGGRVYRIDNNVLTGTDRVYLCYKNYLQNKGNPFIVNVQGDEPFIKGRDVIELTKFHEKSNFDITTFVHSKGSLKDIQDPNQVKVAYTEETCECHYFSRSMIPFSHEKALFFLHVGIYCFTPQSLEQMSMFGPSPLEKSEKLEQLRAIENGMRIGAMAMETPSLSVDSPKDIINIERIVLDQQ